MLGYLCVDRGTPRCPCVLMAAGQCYTCTMVGRGVCSCEEASGWQGVCPYSEYMLQGIQSKSSPQDRFFPAPVIRKIFFSGSLSAVRLSVPEGFVLSCRRPGAYLMAEALGWRTPLSVMRTGRESGDDGSWVEVLLKDCGPKSKALMEAEDVWQVAGPHFNGLPGADRLDRLPDLIVARGTAAAPLVHMLECLGDSDEERILYIDDEGLPEPFLEEYLQGKVFQRIRMNREDTLKQMEGLVRETVQHKKGRALLLVSPYYAKCLTENLTEEACSRLILPNPANLCCGMGICGACSHTDPGGVTVRLCKCSQTVIE